MEARATAELDRGIIDRARRGDPLAVDVVLRRYAGPLLHLVRRSGKAGDVENLTQELLTKVAAVLPGFDPNGPATLSTWLLTIAHRFLIDERRRRHLNLVGLDEGRDVADASPGPDRLLERKQLASTLEAAIARLPSEQRTLFVLAQVHHQPLESIAAVEGLPLGTVKSRLHRARASLALWLASEPRESEVAHGAR